MACLLKLKVGDMNVLRKVKKQLFFRTVLLMVCGVLLGFVGLAFIWRYCLVEAYGIWKPVIDCLVAVPVGWWLLALVLLLLVKGLRYKFVGERNNLLTCSGKVFSVSDAPIAMATEDEFARDAYVRMLSTLIMSASNTKDARYIGIYGQWGDGKTSVRNLVEERIKSDYGENSTIVVDFSPWAYPESTDIRMVFFERLSNAVAKSGYGELSKVSSSLAKHFAIFRINQAVGPVSDLIDWFRSLLCLSFLSEERLTTAIRELLSTMSQKVVIVVDDLDRLSKNEICRVIRFLKANGDLPNITYLILADEDYLANAVSSLVTRSDKNDIDNGREYLRKIVPLRCPLPPINGNRLLNVFKRHLVDVLTGYGLEGENPEDTCDWLLSPYMNNARMWKQLLNAFSIKLATHKRKVGGRKYLGVHIGDLLALTIIEVCEPDVYTNLWDGYTGLLRDSWWFSGSDKGVPEQWMEEHFFKYTRGRRDIVEKFLCERLGVSHSGGGFDNQPKMYKLDNPRAPELLLQYRLASEFNFQHYFSSEEESGWLSQDELMGFLQAIQEERIPKEQIQKLDAAGLLPQLLYALEGEKMLVTKHISDCYMKTLVYMADLQLRNTAPEPFQQSIYVKIYRCMLFYCQDIKSHLMNEDKVYGQNIKYIGELLLPILAENFDVVLTVHLIVHDAKYHEDRTVERYDALFSHEEYDSLCKMFLERIERFQREGRLVGHVEFRNLFYMWKKLLCEYNDTSLNERFKAACLPMTQDVQAINAMIEFFCDDNRLSDPADLIVAIRLDDLTKAFGTNGIEAILTNLEKEPKLLEYTYKALVALRWALAQKRRNKPYGKEDQMAKLKESYESEPIKAEMSAKVATDESRK